MSDLKEIIRIEETKEIEIQKDEAKTKWHWSRKCACGDCRFYSEKQRPKCPAMEMDPTLVGEKLWYMDVSMLGLKDYIDPLDFAPPKAYIEKEKIDEEKEE